MSDTPRTDKIINVIQQTSGTFHDPLFSYLATVATMIQEVERELAAANKANAALRAEVERLREDAERYREARNDPAGFVHLLKLLVRDGDPRKLDAMMDRIIESRERRAAAIDAARKEA